MKPESQRRARRYTSALLMFALGFALVHCGKSQPPNVAPDTRVQALQHFKKFAVAWAPGDYLTGGKAQYAMSEHVPLTVAGHTGVEAKVNLFLFQDDTYALEYFERADGHLRGAAIAGRWSVNDAKKLVLSDEAGKVNYAEGTAVGLADRSGGIDLKFQKDFVPAHQEHSLLFPKKEFKLHYSGRATDRTLPSKLRVNIPRDMQHLNERAADVPFPD